MRSVAHHFALPPADACLCSPLAMGGDHRGGKRHRHGGDGSQHRGGGRGNGGGFRPPPVPGMDRELREMRNAIVHLDGSPEMTGNLAGLLAADLPNLTQQATEFILECVEELPVKTPVYVALVGLLNTRGSQKFVGDFVDSLFERLELRLASSTTDDQLRAKLLVRYITMLPSVFVLKASVVIDTLDSLLCCASDAADVAKSAQKGGSDFAWQPRGDFLVKCALAATPWCGASLVSSTEPGTSDGFDNLFLSTQEYLGKRAKNGPDPASGTFKSATSASVGAGAGDVSLLADDWLEEIFGRVNETRRAGRENPNAWQTAGVPALIGLFDEFSTANEDEAMTTNGESRAQNYHTPPPVKVPDVEAASIECAASAMATFPARPRLRILSQKMTEGLWEAGDWGPLERFVAEEYIADTLAAFEPGFRRGAVIPAAEQLGTLPLPGDHPERCQFLVAETLFGEMLSLPRSPHEPVFYHVVVQDLCSQIPTFPKMMAKVVGQMFTQIARMDYEARDRLANWMAHHLSCFDLAWPWRSWEHVKDQESDHPQLVFCKSVVAKLLRSCFQKRVFDSLPENLQKVLMPDYAALSSTNGESPGLNGAWLEKVTKNGTFEKDGEPIDTLRKLGELLKLKTPAGDVSKWFAETGALAELGPETCASLLTTAVLRHGQKCITHHDVLLTRYKAALLGLIGTDGGAVGDVTHETPGSERERSQSVGSEIVGAAVSIWANTHPRMAVAAVSRLLNLGVVLPKHVATWIETSCFDDTASAIHGADTNTSANARVSLGWGSPDAFEIATLAVETCAARAKRLVGVLDNAVSGLRKIEKEIARLEGCAEDANQRDLLSQRDAFADQARELGGKCVEQKERVARESGPAAESENIARTAAAAIGKALCVGILTLKGRQGELLKEAAVKLKSVAASGKEAGKDAAGETDAFRGLSFALAFLRKFRRVGGKALEAALVDAVRSSSDTDGFGDVTHLLGEAVCGPGGLEAASAAEAMME